VTILDNFEFPIDVKFKYPVSTAEFGFTVVTSQKYQHDSQVFNNGLLTSFASTTNTGKASDVNPPSSSQDYVHTDSAGGSYNCQIESSNNTLTSVSSGCNSPGNK
jgi:hypothetical protein